MILSMRPRTLGAIELPSEPLEVFLKGWGWNNVTVQEVRAINQESSSLCIVVAQDSVVHKVPAKCISYKDNDTLRLHPVFWLCNVGREAMYSHFCTLRMACRYTSTEACWAGHFGRCKP